MEPLILLALQIGSFIHTVVHGFPSAIRCGQQASLWEASALEPTLGLISQGYPTVLFSLHVNKHNPFVGPVLHTISHCLYGKHILLKVRNR